MPGPTASVANNNRVLEDEDEDCRSALAVVVVAADGGVECEAVVCEGGEVREGTQMIWRLLMKKTIVIMMVAEALIVSLPMMVAKSFRLRRKISWRFG